MEVFTELHKVIFNQGQVNQGQEGVQHVGCRVVQTGLQGEFINVLKFKKLDIYLKKQDVFRKCLPYRHD
jgi:hypothetical protein